MLKQNVLAVVAGHICLDIIPDFGRRAEGTEDLLRPGKLVNVGAAVTATGGAVSNTGLALHRLGLPTKLMGKIGDDLFGHAVLEVLRRHDDRLAEGMIISSDEATSYTIVVNPPGADRSFFHCPGANDTFGAGDVDLTQLAGADLFHFGYPPLMRQIYRDGGMELARLMAAMKEAGITTSLDTAYPDPDSEAGRVDWGGFLETVLPHVDLFLPSLEETLFQIDRPRLEAIRAAGDTIDGAGLAHLSERLLAMGAAVILLKLGANGLYLRTTATPARLAGVDAITAADRSAWLGRELLAPAFETTVVGTTGAGDSAIAGFLAGLLQGLPPAATLTGAAAVGAFNVESADAISGIPSWEAVQQRIGSGWSQKPMTITLGEGWRREAAPGVWYGPHDEVDR